MNNRPKILGVNSFASTTELENFQNKTLRPIIKSLNDLIFVYFKNYAGSKKIDIMNISDNERVKFITTNFLRNHEFQNQIKGMVIGHFSIEEFNFYKKSTKEVHKRILKIVKQRILSF